MEPTPEPGKGYRPIVEPLALRRCALAVAVLFDVDLRPSTRGLTLLGAHRLRIPWRECEVALGGADPESGCARERLAQWLRVRARLAELSAAGVPELLTEHIRPHAVPADDERHPGGTWYAEPVLGGALMVGVGLLGADPRRPDDVLPVPTPQLRMVGLGLTEPWTAAADYLHRMGTMAAQRLRRDGGTVLRPMGDCDVVTLLASGPMRAALAGTDANGLCAVAAPTRRRGWLDLARIDPAFTRAAWSLTEPVDRGFPRPLLVTAEEVALAMDGPSVAEVLRDPAADDPPWRRSVRWR